MSKTKRRINQAARRNVYAFRAAHGRDGWDVYAEGEGPLGPRGLILTRREAANLAYAIAVSKRQKLVVTFDPA